MSFPLLLFSAMIAKVKVMEKPPPLSEIKNWIREHNPLGLFQRKAFAVRDIDPKPWSGHFNYLVAVGRHKFVLRFKGPEWGEPTQGILDEYRILKFVEKYQVGPNVYYLTKKFFGESMLFEEYLGGRPLSQLPRRELDKLFSSVAVFIAEINRIQFRENSLPFCGPLLSYSASKNKWKERLRRVGGVGNSGSKRWADKISLLLPQAERMLDEFEERLRRVVDRNGPAFIFRSAHVGHCVNTKKGFRFFNWEQVSWGDPAYTLAVFLASISQWPDFERIKKRMITAYLEVKPVPEFQELVEQRLKEREISDLIWTLWAHVERGYASPVDKGTDLRERFKRVEIMLKRI